MNPNPHTSPASKATPATDTAMTGEQLRRLRWAVRATLTLGVAASVAANVLHARPNPISQIIAAWPPLALLLTVELISRVPHHRRSLGVIRITATAVIAAIATWVSYWHLVGVAARYGETDAGAAYLLPISVDGLVIVASVSLVEITGRIRAIAPTPVALPDTTLAAASTTLPAAATVADDSTAAQRPHSETPTAAAAPTTARPDAPAPITHHVQDRAGATELTAAGAHPQPVITAGLHRRARLADPVSTREAPDKAVAVQASPSVAPAEERCWQGHAAHDLSGQETPAPHPDVEPTRLRWRGSPHDGPTPDIAPTSPAVALRTPPDDNDGADGQPPVASDRALEDHDVPSGTAAAVAYWHRRDPALRPAQIAVRIGRSERTVRRHWPPPPRQHAARQRSPVGVRAPGAAERAQRRAD
ncbi:DUF2637 domain-containing protein [Micromonospora sp. NPDC049460]|uniref:DUF2637 domain-containing protein n=1 Tax=Micromonospora sp. NPDC049460 TaxID=3364272 RepID=UPI00378FC92C